MRRRRKRFNRKTALWAGLAVLVLAAALWGASRAGGLGGGVVGGLDMRPWKRASTAKPVGVRVERATPKPAAPKTASATRGDRPRLAIVLDDWGMSLQQMDDALELNRPLTLAILPNLPYSADVARRARQAGLGVMLHMPMQPKSRSAAREPEVIAVDMSEVRILRYLDEALASVPHVRGVNNHQGSAATSDERVMRIVLSHLKKKGLFFLDSYVIGTTAGPSVAREVGIPFAKRDVFIDNVAEVEPVKAQLRKAVQKALRNGSAIAIGHDKPATLEAIRQMVPEIERSGVRLALVEELVR